jgi:hypothetical protein
MTFMEYIAKRRAGANGPGDFVRDARQDPAMPDARSWEELERYLAPKASPGFLRSARTVWSSYTAARRRSSKKSGSGHSI